MEKSFIKDYVVRGNLLIKTYDGIINSENVKEKKLRLRVK